jgi:hypothetical protein
MKNSNRSKTFLIAALTLFVVVSCSGPSKIVVKIKPDKVEISGVLGDYLQGVDSAYQLSEFWGAELTIKLKGLKKGDVPKNKIIQIVIILLDENGKRVPGTGELKMQSISEDKVLSLLANGSGVAEIDFESASGDYVAEKHAALVKKFSVLGRFVWKEKVMG